MPHESADHFENDISSAEAEASNKNENQHVLRWSLESKLSSANEAAEKIVGELTKRGWTEDERGHFENAVDEAVQNAIIHGNWGLEHIKGETNEEYLERERLAEADSNNKKSVDITLRFEPDLVEVTIQATPRPFFNPEEVPDPTTEEGLEKASGRGMFLSTMLSDYSKFDPKNGGTVLGKFKKAGD